MRCSHCGAMIPDDQMVCPRCGTEVQIVPDYNPLDDVLAREVKGSVEGATRQIQTDDIRRYRRDDRTKNVNSTRVLSREEMDALGWDALDVLLINGDAYVDHPSFGAVLLGRWLTAHGFRVGLVAQPRWDTPDDIARMGRPRLFAGVSAGAVDSLLAHYTEGCRQVHFDTAEEYCRKLVEIYRK